MRKNTTSYKLYGIPFLGSMAIELLMEEAGLKYDIIFPTPEERSSVEFKKISPRGLVPVLITQSGQSIFEGPAIINFLLETYHTNLIAPIGNPDRATCFQWLSFLSTALGNANNRFFFPERYGSTETVIKEKESSCTRPCNWYCCCIHYIKFLYTGIVVSYSSLCSNGLCVAFICRLA